MDRANISGIRQCIHLTCCWGPLLLVHKEIRDGDVNLSRNMNRSAPLLLIAFLAMSALRLPSVSGQMTIPQGIEAVYDNKSGGSRGSKRNVFRKSRSGSSSSWSKKKRKSHSSSSSSSSSSKAWPKGTPRRQ